MTREEIHRRLVEQLQRVKPGLAVPAPEARLMALGLDSTDIAFWLSDAEDDFAIILDDVDLARLRDATLNDLVELVERALARKAQ